MGQTVPAVRQTLAGDLQGFSVSHTFAKVRKDGARGKDGGESPGFSLEFTALFFRFVLTGVQFPGLYF